MWCMLIVVSYNVSYCMLKQVRAMTSNSQTCWTPGERIVKSVKIYLKISYTVCQTIALRSKTSVQLIVTWYQVRWMSMSQKDD